MEYLKTYEGWSDLNPKNWEVLNRKKIPHFLKNIKIKGVKSVKQIESADSHLEFVLDLDTSHIKDDGDPKILKHINNIIIHTSFDIRRKYLFSSMYINFGVDIHDTFSFHHVEYYGEHVGRLYFQIPSSNSDYLDKYLGKSYTRLDSQGLQYDNDLELISSKIESMISEMQNQVDDTKSGILVLQKRTSKMIDVKNQKKIKIDLLKSKADDIEDYLTELYDISSKETRQVSDGRITFNFEIKGIRVVRDTGYDSPQSGSANLIMTDELVMAMRAITSVKKRVDSLMPGIEIRSYFKENQLTMIFMISWEAWREEEY